MDGRAGFGTPRSLLLPEGHAVGALIHGGVGLMGTHQDPLQGAVVSAVAVVCALGNGALDALVGMTVHVFFLLLLKVRLVWPKKPNPCKALFALSH